MRSAKSEPVSERELLARAVPQLPEMPRLDDVTAEKLQRLAEAQGVDFATALLRDRLLRSPRHGPFIEHIERPDSPARRLRGLATLAIVPRRVL